MKAEEAAQIIEEMAKSLKANPRQFNLKINVTTAGAVGIGGSGGAGIVGIAQGGGVGVAATASAPNAMTVEIAQEHGIQKFTEQSDKTLEILDTIKAEFLKSSPSKSTVNRLLGSLEKWVPPVIAAVIGQLAASVFGN